MAKAKVIKKEWYPILAPKLFQNVILGETPAYEPEQMLGKGLTKNLMNLTNDVKRQNININFEIVNVQNGKAFTDIIGYYMAQSSIRRLIRRDIRKIDMSFLCKTSDNKNLQIKPLFITRSATAGSVAAKIRRNAQDFLVKYIGKISYDNFINDLVNHKMQSLLRKEMNIIYPLRICEIRSMELVDLEKKKDAQSETKNGKKTESKQVNKEESKETKKSEEDESLEKKETKAEEKKETKEKIKKEEKTEQAS